LKQKPLFAGLDVEQVIYNSLSEEDSKTFSHFAAKPVWGTGLGTIRKQPLNQTAVEVDYCDIFQDQLGTKKGITYFLGFVQAIPALLPCHQACNLPHPTP
jgi:hypothetical protein